MPSRPPILRERRPQAGCRVLLGQLGGCFLEVGEGNRAVARFSPSLETAVLVTGLLSPPGWVRAWDGVGTGLRLLPPAWRPRGRDGVRIH